MNTLDHILGNTETPQVAPPPVDSSLQGSPNSVGSKPSVTSSGTGSEGDKPMEERQQRTTSEVNVPNISAINIAGKPGSTPRMEMGIMPKKPMNYVELWNAMNPHRPETEEERALHEKKEKRDSMFSAIGDGISAMSNLFFTTQYAPNSYNHTNSLSESSRVRWDKLRAEREAKDREYFEGYMRAAAMDDANARDDRNWKHTLTREKILDARADKKDEREDRKAEQNELMFQAKLLLQQGKLTEQGYRNFIAEVKADKIAELTDAQINRLNRTGNGSGSGRTGEYPWYDSNGNLHYSHSYEAARQNGLLHGSWQETTQEKTTNRQQKTGSGMVKNTYTSKTIQQGKGHSVKPQAKVSPTNGGKKKSPTS